MRRYVALGFFRFEIIWSCCRFSEERFKVWGIFRGVCSCILMVDGKIFIVRDMGRGGLVLLDTFSWKMFVILFLLVIKVSRSAFILVCVKWVIGFGLVFVRFRKSLWGVRCISYLIFSGVEFGLIIFSWVREMEMRELRVSRSGTEVCS